MLLADLLANLGESLGIQDLALQDNGIACIQIPDQFEVTVEQLDEPDQCLIYAFLERVQDASRTNTYAQLLQANLFGAETSDATLSIDEQSGRVVVHRKVSLDTLSGQDFLEIWLRVVGVASQWNERLTTLGDDGQSEDSINSDRPALGQWLSV